MKHIILTITSYFIFTVVGIAQLPGGVDGCANWLVPTSVDRGAQMIDVVDDSLVVAKTPQVDEINYQPVISFQDDIGSGALNAPESARTIFTVFKSNVETEQVIWSLEGGDAQDIIFTTHRLADLRSNEYRNVRRSIFDKPMLSTYTSSAATFNRTTSSNRFLLGQVRRDDLPVTTFTGSIGDVIIFNRLLSGLERNKIESLLALKFGIHKSMTTSPFYQSSTDAIVWDGVKNKLFNQDIAGIGRDDMSCLDQRQSMSTVTDLPITIGAGEIAVNNRTNTTKLHNHSFLLWGHNDEATDFKSNGHGIEKMQRNYLVQPTNWTSNMTTQLRIDHTSDPLFLGVSEALYLVVEETGSDAFSPLNTKFYSAQEEQGGFLFDSVVWASNRSQLFSFFIASKSFIYTDVTAADCEADFASSLTWQAVGIAYPYVLTIRNETGFEKKMLVTADADCALKLPVHGRYAITVEGADGRVIKQSLFTVSNEKVIQEQDVISYHDERIILDVSAYSFDAHRWILPNGQVIFSNTIHAEEAGNYYLIYSVDGCEYIQPFVVRNEFDGLVESAACYPNPTVDGTFIMDIQLESTANMSFVIADAAGRIVDTQTFFGRSHYTITNKINGPAGTYMIIVEVEGQQYTYPIIKL